MRRAWILILLSLSAASIGLAAGTQADLDAMLAADREFGSQSATKPVKEVFLSHIADDSVLFRGGEAVQGKPWTAEQPSPPFKLFLRPAAAGIALSGDLGWTIDPYDLHPDGSDEVHYGEYLSVWKKQRDGRWLIAVNSGVHLPQAGAAPSEPKTWKGGEPDAGKEDPARESAELLAADRELGEATASGTGGTSAAYLARLAGDGILLRNGAAPYEGTEAARGALAKAPAKMASRPTAGEVSGAGDLGYTYGTADWTEGGTTTKANYLRIWEKRGGAWKLRVDCLAEVPAQ
ncbi:MAG TPA: nuclear transport factor 2 family protein [Thermoanaerobaculia bacterium]|jgi:ketosteroid isomerase-like protein|nr:nuclear transport factor 2 family protein [Thermoanaerobaculia bacterium]